MLKKILFLSLFGCLFMTASFGQYTLNIVNNTCSPVDIFYAETAAGTCGPGPVTTIPGFPPFFATGAFFITPGMDIPAVKAFESGNPPNGTGVIDVPCGGPANSPFPIPFGCDGMMKTLSLTFVPPFAYTITIM